MTQKPETVKEKIGRFDDKLIKNKTSQKQSIM